MKRICVFCGSSPGSLGIYQQAAHELGRELVARNLGLVYGGGALGLMGGISRSVQENDGEVIGVVPEGLFDEQLYREMHIDLRVVPSMHARKALMIELADGFIALPGGYGTLEEMFEVLTWAQLGLHKKPCGLLNVDGFFNELIQYLEKITRAKFIAPEHQRLLLVSDSPADLLVRFQNYQSPHLKKSDWAKSLSNGFG